MNQAKSEQREKGSIPRGRLLLFWAIALVGAGFDLATKSYFFRKLGEPHQREPLVVIPNLLELQTNYNKGALWGFLAGAPHSSLLFAGLSILAAAGICYWLFFLGAAIDRRLTVALALIMAGALGNCYDRLVLGQVRDFVHLYIDAIGFDCAIFNFADNMLVVGAIVLVLLALRPDVHEAVEPAAVEPATSA
jgi:signal peptidase II